MFDPTSDKSQSKKWLNNKSAEFINETTSNSTNHTRINFIVSLKKMFPVYSHKLVSRIYWSSHHHHQVPDLEQTLAAMPLQTSLSSDNFKKFKPLLCPPVAELQRLSRNVIRCLPLSRLPSTLPVKDKNSKPLRLHTCPKNKFHLPLSNCFQQ